MKPLVSIIIPAYNAVENIKETLDSVLIQTYQNFEVLIINDGSSDNTAGVVRGFTDERIRYLEQENKGVSAARNKGIAAAQGEWLAFLDSDDLWAPTKLADQLKAAGEYDFLSSDCVFMVDNRPIKRRFNELSPPPRSYEDPLLLLLTGDNYIPALTVLVKTNWVRQVTGFNPKLHFCEDYDLWLRVLAAGAKYHHVNKVHGTYRIHSSNASSNPLTMIYFHADVLRQFARQQAFSKYGVAAKIRSRAVFRHYILMNRRLDLPFNLRVRCLLLSFWNAGIKLIVAQGIFTVSPHLLLHIKPSLITNERVLPLAEVVSK